ncbi:N-acetylmuramidase [uncultured Caudovirales phage]|uniref:N-acetylmuramidase n=1 Tax=uncultured Caudovirales phage TaxID=2100421 RepID=A0A6J7WQR0_9CAUD|nr:N-acetylmuramidase [uncultured Caudovirales phage]
MNSFKGSAHKLSPADISLAASEIGVQPAALAAVIAVESSGSGFDSSSRPKILFEPHIFYRQLSSNPLTQAKAYNLGLAYPKWGTQPYPRSSDAQYDRLLSAIEIDESAALRSASWGLAQIMGFNYSLVGCPDVQTFVTQAMDSELNQLRHLCHFIMASRLDDELTRFDWAGFARGYNGPGYATNSYDKKLAAAYVTNKSRFI